MKQLALIALVLFACSDDHKTEQADDDGQGVAPDARADAIERADAPAFALAAAAASSRSTAARSRCSFQSS